MTPGNPARMPGDVQRLGRSEVMRHSLTAIYANAEFLERQHTILRKIWFRQLRQQRAATLVVMDGKESAMDSAETAKDPFVFYVSRMEHEQVLEAIEQLRWIFAK